MVRGSSHVVPLDRSPPVQVSMESGRSWRRKQSVEGSRDRSREPSRDRSREPSRDRPTGGQRPSDDSQISENGRFGRLSSAVQNPAMAPPSSPASRPTAVGISGKAVAAATGASKRQQAGDGARKTLPPLRIINRHTVVRMGRGGGDPSSPKRGIGLRSPSPSPSSTARGNRPSSTRRNELSPMGKFRAGVFTVDATKAFADLQLEGGRASGGAGGSFGGAAGGGGPGGAGPALGSPGEAALVIQRKDGRERNPGPTLEGIGERGSASSVLLSLKTHKSGPSLVTPHICIGAREDAKNLQALKELGVTHVLNCAKQLPSSHPKEFVHARLEITDTSEEQLAPFQKAGVSFLRQVEGCGGRALVHCIAGCSRSVSIVLLHLMESHRIRLKLAYDHVRSYRMVAQPNEGFRFQLATTEVKMFGSSSVSRDAESIWNFYRWNEVKQGVPYHAIDPPQACGGCTVA